MKKKFVNRFLLILVASVIAYLFLLPLAFMVFTSFKGVGEALGTSSLLPKTWTLENYIALFQNTASSPVVSWLMNTLIVTVLGTALRVIVSTLAAYALARLNVPFRNAWIVALIWALAIPDIVILFPNYYIFKELGMMNSFIPLIAPSGAGVMMTYLVYNFMRSFPKDLEEAAYLDGASTLQNLVHVMIPSIKPILITQGFITFLGLYNDYFWPSLITNRTEAQTISVGLATLVLGENFVNPSLMMATTVVAVVPIMVLFLFANKGIVKGITRSGIK